MRTIKDVIKVLPQLQNQDYNKGGMGQYGEGVYYEFDNAHIVMEENELEIYHCGITQEHFWEDFNNSLEEEWVYDTVDKGSNWINNSSKTFIEDLYTENIDAWRLYSTIHEGSLEDGIEQAFGEYSVSISSWLGFVDTLEINFKDLFEDCYSKTEKVFVLISSEDEDMAAIAIAEGLGLTEDDDIILAIEKGAEELALESGTGGDLTKEQILKLLTMVESDAESITQAFDLAVALDAPNANEAILNSPRVGRVIKEMARARIILSEIVPESWDGTYIDNYGATYFVDSIQERIGENIDEDKPYTMVSAFMYKSKANKYLYINENEINWYLCKDLTVDIAVFEDALENNVVYSRTFKKIYKMKDWYIALS